MCSLYSKVEAYFVTSFTYKEESATAIYVYGRVRLVRSKALMEPLIDVEVMAWGWCTDGLLEMGMEGEKGTNCSKRIILYHVNDQF